MADLLQVATLVLAGTGAGLNTAIWYKLGKIEERLRLCKFCPKAPTG